MLTIEGGESPRPPPMCTSTWMMRGSHIAPEMSTTHQLTGGEGDRMMKPISVWGILGWPWWSEANGQIWPDAAVTLFFANKCYFSYRVWWIWSAQELGRHCDCSGYWWFDGSGGFVQTRKKVLVLEQDKRLEACVRPSQKKALSLTVVRCSHWFIDLH